MDETAARRDEQASDWCCRLAEGQLTFEEEEEFEAWLIADPANQVALERMVSVWQGVGAIANAPPLIGERANALEAMRQAHVRRQRLSLLRRWQRPIAMAAGLAALLVAALFFLLDDSQRYETGTGERRFVALSDGSTLSLDAASAVAVDYDDNRRALTLLAGRAKFDVAKDPLRPFTVTAGDKMVVATGTAFSVELLRREMRVILYEGAIAVVKPSQGPAPPAPVRLAAAPTGAPPPLADQALKPGSELVSELGAETAEVAPADVERSLSWEGGRLSFIDEPLAKAVERVNRYARQHIAIDPAIGDLRINGVFDAGNSESFIDGVAALHDLQVRPQGDTLLLTRHESDATVKKKGAQIQG